MAVNHTRTIINSIPDLHPTSQEYLYNIVIFLETDIVQFYSFEDIRVYLNNIFDRALVTMLLQRVNNTLPYMTIVHRIVYNMINLIIGQIISVDEDDTNLIILPWDINLAAHKLYDLYGLAFDNLDAPGVVTVSIDGNIGEFTQDYVIGYILWCKLHDMPCNVTINNIILDYSYLEFDSQQGANARYHPLNIDDEYHNILSENAHNDVYFVQIGSNVWSASNYDFFVGMSAAADLRNDRLPEMEITQGIYANGEYHYQQITL